MKFEPDIKYFKVQCFNYWTTPLEVLKQIKIIYILLEILKSFYVHVEQLLNKHVGLVYYVVSLETTDERLSSNRRSKTGQTKMYHSNAPILRAIVQKTGTMEQWRYWIKNIHTKN